MFLQLPSLFIVSFVCITATQGFKCNFPSSLWCSSSIIAEKCGVVKQCKQHIWNSEAETGVTPVNFTLYYESLCPDCKQFMQTQLWPTWKKIGNIMNLSLVPYGNAQEENKGGKWIFHCQHGPEECVGNMLEACAIDLMKDVQKWMPYIACVETSNVEPMKKAAEKCASQSRLNFTQILACASSDHGNQLMHHMAQMTDSLQPRHQYVPWVTLNGVHTEDIQQKAGTNLLQLICETYKGVKPSACSSTALKGCLRN